MSDTQEKRLKKHVFRMVAGIEDEIQALSEVMEVLGVKRKQAIMRRKKFNAAEQSAIESIFEKYGVESENIWTDGAN